MNAALQAIIEQQKTILSENRRHFRQHPELSGVEYETQKEIQRLLSGMGIPHQVAGKTGVLAEIQGGRPGKKIAIRADIDALPVPDECGQPYASVNPGVCHACGHDAHTAIVLGVARALQAMKDELPGSYRFIFQPSEEKLPGGALDMIADGALANVDHVIGSHVWQTLEAGRISMAIGPMMASADQFIIKIKGRGGHSSMPYQAIDPIEIGAHLVLALKSLVTNNVAAQETTVLAVGIFSGGTAMNIIPECVTLEGTVRCVTQATREKLAARIEELTKGLCQSYGADCEVKIVSGYPAVQNDRATTETVLACARQALGEKQVEIIPPVMGGEDFAYYQQKVPGTFVFIGAGNGQPETAFPHHHPRFDIDEKALITGVTTLAQAAVALAE